MRIAVVGGGPGGLYFSILMRKIRPDCEVTVYERGAPTDAFGFGVVFSDETLTVFEHADPETYSQIAERFTRWTDIDIHYRGETDEVRWSRLLRARPARAAADPPGAGCWVGRRPALLMRGASGWESSAGRT